MNSTTSIIDDDYILKFARKWLPYGGGTTGDLLVEFGMTTAQYVARLDKILNDDEAHHIGPEFRTALRRFIDTHPTR